MESGYQQEPIGGGRVLFSVRPAPTPGSPLVAMAPAGFLVLILAATTPADPGPLQILIRLAVAVGLGGWLHRWTARRLEARLDRLRSPGGTFVASPFGIETSGARIERERLDRLIVRNALARVPGARGGGGRATAVSYVLCAESGDRSAVMAGGMTETTALGLLADVSRILGAGRPAAIPLEREAGAHARLR